MKIGDKVSSKSPTIQYCNHPLCGKTVISCIGKGLGKDMLKLLVKRIFSFPDAYRITADIDRENHASEKTLLSCGFTLQNPVKSRYILLKSEFIKTS
ncbi:GNAT family N-acetyltransferase [[Clostridium] innocuum]|uniref:GNAT family N-acetyltransferase n=1 Tax=Clostridium innocuum TaxID=1522 RepID=UPI003259B1D0